MKVKTLKGMLSYVCSFATSGRLPAIRIRRIAIVREEAYLFSHLAHSCHIPGAPPLARAHILLIERGFMKQFREEGKRFGRPPVLNEELKLR
ncbi:hypothetical protein IE991_28605 [Klebsiella pneumoniae]|uniref:Uncharacterized protein n=1 Tax=Klebsiella pneumoniae TaxID=573 RepID=A0A927D9F7_KLEPN|nr:hypothetical protein [Klebsiella pneumoniae]